MERGPTSDRSIPPLSHGFAFRRCLENHHAPTHTHTLPHTTHSPTATPNKNNNTLPALAAGLLPLLAVSPALAGPGGDNHLLTGQLVSLVHPAIMFFLFGASGWAGWLGWQWRRARELATEVKELKATLAPAGADGVRPASPADATIKAKEEVRGRQGELCVWWDCFSCSFLGEASLVYPPGSNISFFPPPNCPTVTLTPTLPPPPHTHQKSQERKAIISAGVRDKHANWGSLLLALGVAIAIEGPTNTYLRTGKLFPGPHLYAGAGIVILWAAAAALTPAMQKGNESARSAHIALNTINLALFAWQIPTGLDIVAKVFQFTTLP